MFTFVYLCRKFPPRSRKEKNKFSFSSRSRYRPSEAGTEPAENNEAAAQQAAAGLESAIEGPAVRQAPKPDFPLTPRPPIAAGIASTDNDLQEADDLTAAAAKGATASTSAVDEQEDNPIEATACCSSGGGISRWKRS